MSRNIASCLLLFSSALVSSTPVMAQTACPQGVGPGSAQCGPSGGGMSPAPSRQPSARWKLTWGAFSTDADSNVVGTSTGQSSKRAARRAAVERCKQMGGTNCRPEFEYEHQCAVAVEPIEVGDGIKIVFGRGPTIEAASGYALPMCQRENGGRMCEVKFSNCTEPYLIYD